MRGTITTENNLTIPVSVQESLELWIKHKIIPGSFLTAVLENDLSEAVGRADEISIICLRDIVRYLYNNCPLGCWGSPEKVKEWRKQ